MPSRLYSSRLLRRGVRKISLTGISLLPCFSIAAQTTPKIDEPVASDSAVIDVADHLKKLGNTIPIFETRTSIDKVVFSARKQNEKLSTAVHQADIVNEEQI